MEEPSTACRFQRSLLPLKSSRPTVAEPSVPAAASPQWLPLNTGARDEVAVYDTVFELPAVWDELLGPEQRFLSRNYLQLFEAYPPQGFGFSYLLFYRKGKAVGVAACQLIDFRLTEKIQQLQRPAPQANWWQQQLHLLRLRLLQPLRFRLLLCGASQLTGEQQSSFPGLNPAMSYLLLTEGLEELSRHLTRKGWRPQAVLIKDFYEGRHPALPGAMRQEGYHRFPFQPNMVLGLPEEWQSFDDYLQAMVSKYRVRAKRAFKKRKGVEQRTLSLEDLRQYESRIYELYLEVAKSADVSLMELKPEYFVQLKEQLQDDFTVLGYFKEDELIGFCTALPNGRELEAHFLGYAEQHNYQHQLYLNMLYDIVRLGIERYRSESVIFARTAMEIKSSVGARPVSMGAYMRYRCSLLNQLLPAAIRAFEPQVSWKQRHPFKS